jgi:PAS domain S-box-containing protein
MPLPQAIINYVARTHEPVVLPDAGHAGEFRQDPYIMACQPKSVLCMPLLHQRQLTGLFYLENNLTTNAFTADRVEILSLLSSQAAISIENAQLYENLAVSEQRFRTLFEHAPLGLFEIDLSAGNPLIVAANRQAELVYGWSAAEFANVPIEGLAPPDALLQIRQTFNNAASGRTVTLETTCLRQDGDLFPARISATPQGGSGLRRLIVTVEDITFEKQRQAEIEAIEAERRRIAHEIHDGLAQDLAALRFKVTLWHDLVDKTPTHMHAELDQLMQILNGSIREVRRSIFALRPIALDELGFFPALRQFCTNFGEQYQLQIELNILGVEERLPAPFELPLFRVVQETLNNVRKHAQAQAIQICLDLRAASLLTLTIHDDGQGFDPATLQRVYREGHVGLKQMAERVKSSNGAFSIQSQPGQGATIQVTLPLADRQPAEPLA